MKPSIACLALGLLIAGCAGQATRRPANDVSRIPEQGDWFCQLSESGTGWTCVQDPQLAEHPIPERLPQPPPPAPQPLPMLEPGPESEALPERETRAQQEEAAPEPTSAPEPPSEPEPSLEPAPVPAPTATAEASAPEGVRLMELPGDFYIVQLVAMNSRKELQNFVRRHDLEGTLAVQVERDGDLYHVLLLGVYETLEDAKRALAELPAPFQEISPWIRPLRSLQAAMTRARTLQESEVRDERRAEELRSPETSPTDG